jgi:3-hydroxyisobutyrate dehydrogenase
MVRQYFKEPIMSVKGNSDEASLQLVLDLMEVTNIVAAAEAIAFARYLEVDLKQFFTLVSDAAGASRQFMTKGLEMIEGLNAGNGGETLDEAALRLEKAVQKARDLHCPLNLGNAALSVLYMAKRAGLGGEGSASVVKAFGK